jgi:hypothetical protein
MELFLLLFIAIRRRRRRKKAPNSGPTPGDRDLHPSKHIEEEEGLRRCSCVISFRPFLAWLTFKCLKTLFFYIQAQRSRQALGSLTFDARAETYEFLRRRRRRTWKWGRRTTTKNSFFLLLKIERERESQAAVASGRSSSYPIHNI